MSKHWYYLKMPILVLLAVLSAVLIFKLPNLIINQLSVLVVLILGYLVWALLHHLHDKSLTLEVILEYILTAALVLVILLGYLS